VPTLVEEDGTGLSNANAYVDRGEVDTYQENRGRTDWAALANAVKDAAIIRATQYVDMIYGARFIGTKGSETQALEWPREEAYDVYGNEQAEVVPAKLKEAICELALYAYRVGELLPRPPNQITETLAGVTAGTSTGYVKKERKRVGPIEKEVEYMTASGTPGYPSIDKILRSLLNDGNGGVYR
jgi:hypothetical protein